MTTNPSTTPPVVRFYDPAIQAADPTGRTLTTILSLPDTELEYLHDYIQLLFPLPEPSPFHPSAPIIDNATFLAFRSRPDLQSQLTNSLTRMLHFYGFSPSWSHSHSQAGNGNGHHQPLSIAPGANFARASKNWLKRFNHNHLRITRIIRCLRVLGLDEHAALFYRALNSVYDEGRSGIGARSMMFWRRAAERPLYLAPEDEEDEGRGKNFLYEYEASKRAGAGADGDGAAWDGDGEGEGEGEGGDGVWGKDGPV